MHLRKPGSCVSLLPVTRSRSRRVRESRPCCGAARFHVSFHDKRFHRGGHGNSLFFRLPDWCLRRGPAGQKGGKEHLHPSEATCVILSLLPSSSGSLTFSASNRAKRAPKSRVSPLQLVPPRPPTPKRSNLPRFGLPVCDGCSLAFSPPNTGLLSLAAPRFCR